MKNKLIWIGIFSSIMIYTFCVYQTGKTNGVLKGRVEGIKIERDTRKDVSDSMKYMKLEEWCQHINILLLTSSSSIDTQKHTESLQFCYEVLDYSGELEWK